jgi:hypothetical protein
MTTAPVGCLDGEQAIRDALAAGPTPGPWDAIVQADWPHRQNVYITAQKWGVVATVSIDPSLEHMVESQRANLRLIAACNPETMRALLAELDRLRSASRQEGWQLVPATPTKEMIEAAMHVKRVRLLEVVAQIRAGMDEAEARTPAVIAEWEAMLAAAPQQSQEAQGDRHGE